MYSAVDALHDQFENMCKRLYVSGMEDNYHRELLSFPLAYSSAMAQPYTENDWCVGTSDSGYQVILVYAGLIFPSLSSAWQ